jgi:hypothetical protein
VAPHRNATSINSLPHGRSWKFLTQVLEGVTIQLSSSSSGVTHSEALRVSFVRWVVVYSSRSENPPIRLGFPEGRVPLMGRLAQIPRGRSSGGKRSAEHWKTANRVPHRFEPLRVRAVKGHCIVATEAEDCISFPVPQNLKLDDFRGTRIGVELVNRCLSEKRLSRGHGAGALHGKTVLGDVTQLSGERAGIAGGARINFGSTISYA